MGGLNKIGLCLFTIMVLAGRDMHAAAGGIRLRVRDSRINPAVITGCSDNRIYYGYSAEYRIRVDPSGKVWVFVTDMDNRRSREVGIFSFDGRYLWHDGLRLPAGLSYAGEPAFHKDRMLVYAEAEDGEGRLVKYALKIPGT
ncbi:MAG TPA: hypothetical protein ENN40_06400 [Candidatus Aminicenantes bacterium]|nr:hypothetical protein [Candidatus Aminicenantes bacterium]